VYFAGSACALAVVALAAVVRPLAFALITLFQFLPAPVAVLLVAIAR